MNHLSHNYATGRFSAKLRLFFYIGIGLLLLVGCQTNEPVVSATAVITPNNTPSPIETATASATAVVQPTPVPPPSPKELIVCMAQEPDTLYPYGSSMLSSTAIQHAIYENYWTELSFDFQPQALEKIPSLADGDARLEPVEVATGDLVVDANVNVVTLETGITVVNAAGETVTFNDTPLIMNRMVVDFTMKPTVWADGTPVTAADSVYSYKLAAHPDTPVDAFKPQRTDNYEAIDDLSVRWTGLPGFLDSEYDLNFWRPYPQHLWQMYTPQQLLTAEISSQMPIGDGPFRIQEWRSGEYILFEPNPYYYRANEGLPYLDSLRFRFIPDTNQLLGELLAGDCDIVTQDALTVSVAPFLIEAEAGGLLKTYFQTGTVFEHIDFGINPTADYAATRPDWFEDVQVRQALTMCTNRQGMVDDILYGRSQVIHTYIPEIHPLYPQELTIWPYDVTAANLLLDEAGYLDTNGDGWRQDPVTRERFAVRLDVTVGNDMREQVAQIFKSNMADCGVDIEIQYTPTTELFATGPDGILFGRRFDVAELAWLTGVNPECVLYHSAFIPTAVNGWSGQNETGFTNEAFDAACNTALGSLPGTPEYIQAHQEAVRIFTEQVPAIPLFLRLKVAAIHPDVVNFQLDPTQTSELYNLYELDKVPQSE